MPIVRRISTIALLVFAILAGTGCMDAFFDNADFPPLTAGDPLIIDGWFQPVDLDQNGVSELLGLMSGMEGRLAPVGGAAVVLRTSSGDPLESLAIEGGAVGLHVFPNKAGAYAVTLLGDSLLAVSVTHGGVDGLTVGKPILLASRNDCRNKPGETAEYGWDPRIKDLFTYLHPETGAQIIVFVTSSGFLAAPRGYVQLSAETGEVLSRVEFGGKPTSVELFQGRGLVRLLVGTHASDNYCERGGMSDNTAYLAAFDLLTDEPLLIEDMLSGRNGSVVLSHLKNASPGADRWMVATRRPGRSSATVQPFDPISLELGAASLLPTGTTSLLSADTNGDGTSEFYVVTREGVLLERGSDFERRFHPDFQSAFVIESLVDKAGDHLVLKSGDRFLALDHDRSVLLDVPAYGKTLFAFDRIRSGAGNPLRIIHRTPDPDQSRIYEMKDRAWLTDRERFLVVGLAVFSLVLCFLTVFVVRRRMIRRTLKGTSDLHHFLAGVVTSGVESDLLKTLQSALEQCAPDPTCSVTRLAKACGYSSGRQLNESLNAWTGRSARELIEIFRLQRGKVLLETTDDSIEEISDSVGFRSHQYFATRFKKAFGTTPSEWRGSHGGSGVNGNRS